MFRILVLILVLNLPLVFSAQGDSRYSRVDSAILAFSEEHNAEINELVEFVNSNFSSDTSKVRAYYRWISENIDYDVPLMVAMSSGEEIRHQSQDPDTVFESKKAVCEGYARLMKKLCESSGIACEIIPGYSKASEDDQVMDLFHAWNAVRVDGVWSLVDVTWSNNYMIEGEYHKDFNGKYFLDAPEVFAKDHLPLDPMWQLQSSILTKSAFFDNTGERMSNVRFNDSIAKYIGCDPKQRHYLDMVHYHQFDPDNIRFTRAIDVIHNNTAAHFLMDATNSYLQYVDLFANDFSAETVYDDCKKASELLRDSRNNLTLTINYLKDKNAFTEEFNKNFDEIRKTARTNLDMVNRNLEILGRYQKKLSVATARKQ
jgi:hypothetical protein